MNAEVGETTLKLGDKEYILRPSFKAMVERERLTDSSINEIMERISVQSIRYQDIAAICYACMKEASPNLRLDFEDVGQMVLHEGIQSCALPAVKAISSIMSQKKTDAPQGEGQEKLTGEAISGPQ